MCLTLATYRYGKGLVIQRMAIREFTTWDNENCVCVRVCVYICFILSFPTMTSTHIFLAVAFFFYWSVANRIAYKHQFKYRSALYSLHMSKHTGLTKYFHDITVIPSVHAHNVPRSPQGKCSNSPVSLCVTGKLYFLFRCVYDSHIVAWLLW